MREGTRGDLSIGKGGKILARLLDRGAERWPIPFAHPSALWLAEHRVLRSGRTLSAARRSGPAQLAKHLSMFAPRSRPGDLHGARQAANRWPQWQSYHQILWERAHVAVIRRTSVVARQNVISSLQLPFSIDRRKAPVPADST